MKAEMLPIAKRSAMAAIVFFVTLVGLTSAYAALTAGLSTSDRTSSGSVLSSASWNRLVNSVLELDTRTAAITASGSNLGIGTSNPQTTLDVNGSVRSANLYVWTSATAINDLIFARPEVPYSYVATVCPSPSRPLFTHMKSIGKTGSQLCALDSASDGAKTTCNSVKYVILKTDGSHATYPAWDMACSAAIDYPWPWANGGSNNSRPDEWISGSKVVCCQ